MSMNPQKRKEIIEAALFAAGRPLAIDRLQSLFDDDDKIERDDIKKSLDEIAAEWAQRSVELKQVSSGFRFQVRQELSPWISRLSEERPVRYTRALLETLALIIYRQPITRAEIEDIRGVAVSTSIVKTLLEREWVKVVGHREVPGKPALFGTTRQFLDYFNLKSLSELPPLADIRSIDDIQSELELKIAGGTEVFEDQFDEETTETVTTEETVALLAVEDDSDQGTMEQEDADDNEMAAELVAVGDDADEEILHEQHPHENQKVLIRTSG